MSKAKPSASRAILIPFLRANPYQGQLSDGLAAMGVAVEGRPNLKGIFWELLRTRDRESVIHLHWLPRFDTRWIDLPRAILFAVRIKILKVLGCRVVWTVHNLQHHEVLNERLDRWVARRVALDASRIIVHSATAKKLVVNEFGLIRDEKISIIPHGHYLTSYPNEISASDARRKLEIPKESLVFLFLGNIRPYKGVLELIQQHRELGKDQNSVLLIVGSPLNQSWVEQVGEAVGDDKTIRLNLAFVPDDEIQIYMNACDVVVFPYRDILTSGAVVLAMSFAKPCIAPKLGCITDMLDQNGSFLYDPNAEAGLARALRKASNARDQLPMMGAHNRDVASKWDWAMIAKQTKACYDE